MEDNILWLICEQKSVRLCFYMLAPYLHEDKNNFYAKLVYSTQECFQEGNILKVKGEEKWYKTIHYMENDKRRTVDDLHVQELACRFGFDRANGVWSSLNAIPKESITKIVYPPKILDVYGESEIKDLLQEIADFYDLRVEDLTLSGSGGFFRSPISKLNDLDVIVPINSEEQLVAINELKIPLTANKVRQKNKFWSLRWINDFNLIVCPFFIYGEIGNPVVNIRQTDKRVKGKIKITNSNYGIFNIPLYECVGVIESLMIKASFLRGEIKNNSIFVIDCPIYVVTEGLWAGREIALIKDYRSAVVLLESEEK